MSLMFILIASGATVAATLITGGRVFGYKRIAKNATLIDVVFTALMLVLFAGTLTGMLVAILSGLLMALILSGMKVSLKLKAPKVVMPKLKLKEHQDWQDLRDEVAKRKEPTAPFIIELADNVKIDVANAPVIH